MAWVISGLAGRFDGDERGAPGVGDGTGSAQLGRRLELAVALPGEVDVGERRGRQRVQLPGLLRPRVRVVDADAGVR